MKIEYELPFRRTPLHNRSLPGSPSTGDRPPRIARLVALAHRLDELVRSGGRERLCHPLASRPHLARKTDSVDGTAPTVAGDPGIPSLPPCGECPLCHGARVALNRPGAAVGSPATSFGAAPQTVPLISAISGVTLATPSSKACEVRIQCWGPRLFSNSHFRLRRRDGAKTRWPPMVVSGNLTLLTFQLRGKSQ